MAKWLVLLTVLIFAAGQVKEEYMAGRSFAGSLTSPSTGKFNAAGGGTGGSFGPQGGGRQGNKDVRSSVTVPKASESMGLSSVLTPEQEEYQRRLRAAGLLLDSTGALL